MKQLQEFTDPGVYTLQVPGNGEKMAYVADPQMRLQRWGANRHNNFVQVESELWGMQHKLTRDCTQGIHVNAFPIRYETEKGEVTAQSRTLNPAWELRSEEKTRWDPTQQDYQKHVLIPFQNNNETRQSARDTFRSV
jgi:hypothetical protein